MVLLTGFEPFTTGQGLKLTHNPTADIATNVAARLEGVEARVLPVSFEATKSTLQAAFDELHPRIWIGLGFAPHRETLDIETVALNLEHAESHDNDGAAPWMRAILPAAPMAYRSKLDEVMATQLFSAHGLPAKASVHAGSFLCNQVFFLGCHAVATRNDVRLAAFIHVPPLSEFEVFEHALIALIEALSLDHKT
jgi:pyroglutamyl-peptidase